MIQSLRVRPLSFIFLMTVSFISNSQVRVLGSIEVIGVGSNNGTVGLQLAIEKQFDVDFSVFTGVGVVGYQYEPVDYTNYKVYGISQGDLSDYEIAPVEGYIRIPIGFNYSLLPALGIQISSEFLVPFYSEDGYYGYSGINIDGTYESNVIFSLQKSDKINMDLGLFFTYVPYFKFLKIGLGVRYVGLLSNSVKMEVYDSFEKDNLLFTDEWNTGQKFLPTIKLNFTLLKFKNRKL